jgi:hypothetical protein
VDFFILPMDGCQVVLGTQWLSTLGPILWDFAKLLMKFPLKNQKLELRGLKQPVHRLVQERKLEGEVKRRKIGWVCHIWTHQPEPVMQEELRTIVLGAQQKGTCPTNSCYSKEVDQPMSNNTGTPTIKKMKLKKWCMDFYNLM